MPETLRFAPLAFVLLAGCAVACAAGCATSGEEPTAVPSAGDAQVDGATTDAADAGDGGFGADAAPLDAPPETVAIVYANTDDTLYKMDPETKAVSAIGAIEGLATGEDLTDIGVDADGKVFGVTVGASGAVGHVVELAIPASGAGAVKATLKRDLAATRRFYALAFAPKGVLGADEALVGGDSEGDLWLIPTDGASPQKLGTFGLVSAGDPGGGKTGDTWQLSGDVVFFSNAGAPVGFATIRACAGTSCVPDSDVLVEIDLAALGKKLPTSSLLKRFVGAASGHGRLFGVGAWNDEVFAFQRSSASNPAQLVSISLVTGKGVVLKDFPEITTAKNGWSGAGVTTSAKISVPK